MTYCTEKIYYYSIKRQELLILKCDGYKKNKNVPKKVLKLLKKKYKHGFDSFENKYFYIINLILLYV